jgi:dolichol-phosphate mannosyltransferase
MNKKKKVSIILCCYNESANIPVISEAILSNIKSLENKYDFEIIFVNDGSSDLTEEVIEEICKNNPSVFYIEFSRNFGHQNALKAGLDYSTGDCIVSMDSDMQHPPHIIFQFLEKWEEGYDIVYTRRMADINLPLMKRLTSAFFYKFLNILADIKLEAGTADFRLMSRRAANVIIGIKGQDLFIRGLVKWIGFNQYAIDYKPAERLNGRSKYNVKKMVRLGIQGILSFSTKPLNIALYIGFIVAVLSLLCMPYAFFSYFFTDRENGWASLICVVSFLGGLQLFILGIIGLYLGRVFNQVKFYPAYIVRKTNLSNII